MTMQDETYNGYANQETWLVSLYIDGNYTGEGTYLEVLQLTRDCHSAYEGPVVLHRIAQELEEYVEQLLEEEIRDGASLLGDLLGTTLARVDWRELAESKLAEITE